MFTQIRRWLMHPVMVSSAVVTTVLCNIQYLGVFQQQELQFFDRMMQMRAEPGLDSRLLIVGLTEEDIQKYKHPLPDELFVKVFNKLEKYQPRAIGFDFYRDQAANNDQKGHDQLLQHLEQSDIIISICNHADVYKSNINSEVAPPKGVQSIQLGFSNLLEDSDGIIRRNLLLQDIKPSSKCTATYSLGLQLALKYLEVGGIEPKVTPNNELQIRDVLFKRLKDHSGGYQNINAKGGYQILLNYRYKQVAQQVSIADVLTDKVSPNLIKDKVILVGATAPSLNDIFNTPLSSGKNNDFSGKMPGVFIHANSVSQILSAVLNKKPLFWFLPLSGEIVWLWSWSFLGGLVAFRIRHPIGLGIAAISCGLALLGCSFAIFTQAGWLPIVSPFWGLVLTGGSILAYSAYHNQKQQEKILEDIKERENVIIKLQTLLEKLENGSTEIRVSRGFKIPLNTVLNKRYKLFKHLANGAFGTTYLAEDTQKKPHHSQYVVLVKQLYTSNTNQEYLELARRLFNNEAKFLERLGKHDRIPQFLAYFEDNYQFFIVQEFIKGHTLTQEINCGKKLSVSQVTQILKDVLEVLIFVHNNKIIHRDIKPDNLIRREQDQRIVLIDFGAIKQIHPQQPDNHTVSIGTIGYAPPEQISGSPRFNSDIYALGIIGIQALTNINPREFQRDTNTGKIIIQSLPEGSVQNWQQIASVSQNLTDILDMMVCLDHNRRYQSATEVLKDIENLNNIMSG